MSKYKELKQYLEKELQTKKFLTEGVDAVNNLEKLDDEKKTLESSIKKLANEEAQAKDSLSAVKQQISDANKKLKEAQDKAATVIVEAEATAKAIEKGARENARSVMEAAEKSVKQNQNRLELINTDINNAAITLKDLNTEVAKIKEAKTRLLEKLSA